MRVIPSYPFGAGGKLEGLQVFFKGLTWRFPKDSEKNTSDHGLGENAALQVISLLK